MINILNSINELHDLCLAQAEANLPFGSGQDFESVDGNKLVFVGNVYDAAFAGAISCSVSKNAAQAHDIAHAFKLLFCLSPYDYDILGSRYSDYCMALCYYLARIDYECFKSKFYGDIDYDFYEICVKEGIEYNRMYFMYIFDFMHFSFRGVPSPASAWLHCRCFPGQRTRSWKSLKAGSPQRR